MNRYWLLLGFVAALACNPCSNDIQSRETSPDDSLDAFVYVRGCGLAGPAGIQVSVLRAGAKLHGTGNVFQMFGTDSVTAPNWRETASVHWLGPRHLEISFDAHGDVRWAVTKWGNVSITYHPTSTDTARTHQGE